ncbi:hypothetical protein ACFYMW_09365 [Streptomyces sp. NPDC006692]|uniref:hypothetical protein n=1 Tax=Streptomyces sp. NPDC006692 TaxID=3364758 RepID=UPI0036A9C7C5
MCDVALQGALDVGPVRCQAGPEEREGGVGDPAQRSAAVVAQFRDDPGQVRAGAVERELVGDFGLGEGEHGVESVGDDPASGGAVGGQEERQAERTRVDQLDQGRGPLWYMALHLTPPALAVDRGGGTVVLRAGHAAQYMIHGGDGEPDVCQVLHPEAEFEHS